MDLAALLKLGNRDVESTSAKEAEEVAAVNVRVPQYQEPRRGETRARTPVEEKTE